MSLHRSDIRDEGGQALVEFALILPILLLLLFGALDFGKAFNYWNDATHLTAEAARYAAVNRKPDPSSGQSLQAQIQAQTDTAELRNGSASVTKASVCISFPNGTSNPGDPVKVTMSFRYTWLPFIGNSVPLGAKDITSTAIMRLEAPPTNYGAGCA
jgi:Flp pilus assembly protein TadG